MMQGWMRKRSRGGVVSHKQHHETKQLAGKMGHSGGATVMELTIKEAWMIGLREPGNSPWT